MFLNAPDLSQVSGGTAMLQACVIGYNEQNGEEKSMLRKISVGWFKQRSGSYALKGITISEDNRAYDSMSTFRDEDARWLTMVLGAEADVELSSNKAGERTPDGYPEWALKTRQENNSDPVAALDWERAGATLLRHFLSRMVEGYDTKNGSNEFYYLASEANAALLATDAGTHYTLDEAHTILDRRIQKLEKAKSTR
jgi:hypothetical protein